ncbi:patatin-like phospholipase family protein [Catenovulum sp. 2E275]|uniref:patatin-like phospholipase family protein n=1 Tax=Catenovulum sp. 2E275 TaxID=2980497 RepID=UPI0021CF919F|nr:patatin-like phospholipase family protein [Catenovulum sp. 2E275]MCU4674887.1 patatin-like phospholipase family protein [Catenovulum sp. 2E275]
MTDKNKFGLLLLGGGARAAYQVGVLKALAQTLPRKHGLPFPILSGTSAGAINATALSCYASCFHLGVKKLEWVWKNFQTDMVYQSNFKTLYRNLLKNFSPFKDENISVKNESWFDNSPLRELLEHLLDLNRIQFNIDNHYLKAISVTASSYHTGDSVCLYQSGDEIKPWVRAKRRGIHSPIKVEHLMASSAIPMVFPSVELHGEYFGDGSINQLAPLSAPIHLGAQKIFIIGMDQPKNRFFDQNAKAIPPTGGAIVGHLLDTIFSDVLTSDIERMERINQTLNFIRPEYQDMSGLKNIQTLQINPTKSFSEIAAKHYESMPFSIRGLLKILGINANTAHKSSLISYLLFEQNYCRELIQVGFEDGMARIDEIRAFLEID